MPSAVRELGDHVGEPLACARMRARHTELFREDSRRPHTMRALPARHRIEVAVDHAGVPHPHAGGRVVVGNRPRVAHAAVVDVIDERPRFVHVEGVEHCGIVDGAQAFERRRTGVVASIENDGDLGIDLAHGIDHARVKGREVELPGILRALGPRLVENVVSDDRRVAAELECERAPERDRLLLVASLAYRRKSFFPPLF